MLTWKVALVLLIFALILTELSPHSSFLFGIASEIEMIDAWACLFLFFFYMAYLQFSVLQVRVWEGFLLLFFFPSLTKITGLWVPGTEYQFWCRQLEWENPLLALVVTPALSWRHSPLFICWLILESLLCGDCQLSWIKCNAFQYELLPTNDWAKPVYSFK